jgi:hypothetical protein
MGFQEIDDTTPIGFLPNADGVYSFSNFQQYLNNTPATFAGAAGITTASRTSSIKLITSRMTSGSAGT